MSDMTTAEPLICTLPVGLNSTLAAAYTLNGSCASAVPFSPGTYTLGNGITAGMAIVIVAVAPHTRGHVEGAGIDIAYERGFRHGDQRTGFEIDTRTRRS